MEGRPHIGGAATERPAVLQSCRAVRHRSTAVLAPLSWPRGGDVDLQGVGRSVALRVPVVAACAEHEFRSMHRLDDLTSTLGQRHALKLECHGVTNVVVHGQVRLLTAPRLSKPGDRFCCGRQHEAAW